MDSSVNIKSLGEVLSYGFLLSSSFKKVIVGRSSENRAAESALCAGLLKGSAVVYLAGKCIKPQLFTAAQGAECSLCVYIANSSTVRIELCEPSGLPCSFSSKSYIKASRNLKEGHIVNAEIFKDIYLDKLSSILPLDCPYKITVSSCADFSLDFGNPTSHEEIVVQLSADGTRASLYSDMGGFISHDQLIMLCCLERFEKGLDCALPYDFSFAADSVAKEYGRKVLRYFSCSDTGEDADAREMAGSQRFTADGIFLALNAVRIISEKGISLKDSKKLIPTVHTIKKYIPGDPGSLDLISGREQCRTTPEGKSFSDKNGRILLRPSDSGRGIWINVESFSMETASEICDKIEHFIARSGKV